MLLLLLLLVVYFFAASHILLYTVWCSCPSLARLLSDLSLLLNTGSVSSAFARRVEETLEVRRCEDPRTTTKRAYWCWDHLQEGTLEEEQEDINNKTSTRITSKKIYRPFTLDKLIFFFVTKNFSTGNLWSNAFRFFSSCGSNDQLQG